MKAWWRPTLLVSIVVFGLVATAVAPLAAGGAGGGPANLPAGDYQTTTKRANFNFNGAFPAPQITINVSDTTQVSKPLGVPSTTTRETDLFLQVFSYTAQVNGCFILSSPSDFTVSSDLKTAALHTSISSATQLCPGYPANVPSAFTLDVTWTGTGPILTSSGNSHYTCLKYQSHTTSLGSGNNATATASLTPLFPDSFTTPDQAGLDSSDQRVHAAGVIQDACPAQVFGKGAGGGPPAAGKYHNTSLQAGVSFSGSPLPQGFITVSDGTQTSHSTNGARTVTHETHLFVQVSTQAGFGFGCFIIAPGDFTNTGVQTAELKTTVTAGVTPTCPGPTGGLPSPITLDVKWSGTGPVSTLDTKSRLNCLGYSLKTHNVTLSSSARVTATVTTPDFSNTFTSIPGSLVSGDVHIHAKGVDQPACINRG